MLAAASLAETASSEPAITLRKSAGTSMLMVVGEAEVDLDLDLFRRRLAGPHWSRVWLVVGRSNASRAALALFLGGPCSWSEDSGHVVGAEPLLVSREEPAVVVVGSSVADDGISSRELSLVSSSSDVGKSGVTTGMVIGIWKHTQRHRGQFSS